MSDMGRFPTTIELVPAEPVIAAVA